MQLSTEADHEHTVATKTAADGGFALKNVPAGRYKLTVSRNGYVSGTATTHTTSRAIHLDFRLEQH